MTDRMVDSTSDIIEVLTTNMQATVEEMIQNAKQLSAVDRSKLIAALAGSDETVPGFGRLDVFGKFAHVLSPVDDFLRRKRDENEVDDHFGHSQESR
jgi:hypothetical protein